MSTVVVCLRSRLLSEAVAGMVSTTSELAAVPAEPSAVTDLTAGSAEPVHGLLADGEAAARFEGPVSCPVVMIGRREQDIGGLGGEVIGLRIDVGPAELVDALRTVAEGRPELPPRTSPVDRGRRAGDRSQALTPREREVLEHIAAAASPAEIAAALDVSQHTVRTHVQNLLAKLEARSKVDAVARARALGLLDAGDAR